VNSIPFELPGFRVQAVENGADYMTILAQATASQARCPVCQELSRHIHSHYLRVPQDLPSSGKPIRLRLEVRRFRCRNAACLGRIFCERLPDVVAVKAQRAVRLAKTLTTIGLALGGQAGARHSKRLGISVCPNSLLGYVRRYGVPARPGPAVLGVDDFALRKGQVYGTLLVDGTQHHVVDMIPDRTAEALCAWLQTHPGVQIITRDRSTEYTRGASQGAPTALQVADRWHLLKNLSDSLRESVEQHAKLLRQIIVEPVPAQSSQPIYAKGVTKAPEPRPLRPVVQARLERRAHWEDIFQQAHALLAAGMSVTAVARQLGIDRSTVGKYRQLSSLPVKTCTRLGPRLLDPFRPYIRRRVQEANPTASRLLAEIQALGFTGKKGLVFKYLRQVRAELGLPGHACGTQTTLLQPAKTLTPRLLVMFVMMSASRRSSLQEHCISQARQLHPDLDRAIQLALDFARALRERTLSALDDWIVQASASALRPLKSFALAIRDDAAVRAAFTLPFSNGLAEGHVNRLKTLKRSMYGRANFDLLRVRVLAAA
jgi:transposase